MEEIKLAQALADEMVAHCLAGRPHEACGILGAEGGRIVKVFRMTNVSASPVRYSLDPKEQFAVYKTLDDSGWELGGVFHSHTRTAAYPSPTDVRKASEDVPYLIVSLAQDPPDIKGFRIIKERWDSEDGEIQEVPVIVER
ncbi:MAG TPA: M67 family metallopeptidase [Actinomycetota bacterium]|nr:M67 family metallopeptidase [Actinomycetota bacterium]